MNEFGDINGALELTCLATVNLHKSVRLYAALSPTTVKT